LERAQDGTSEIVVFTGGDAADDCDGSAGFEHGRAGLAGDHADDDRQRMGISAHGARLRQGANRQAAAARPDEDGIADIHINPGIHVHSDIHANAD